MTTNPMPAGWGFNPKNLPALTPIHADEGECSEADHENAANFQSRIYELYSNVQAIGTVRLERIYLFPQLAVQHFQGYLVGHQSFFSLLRGVRAAARWTQFPDALIAAFVGMAAEAGLDAGARKQTKTKRPLHTILSAGALIEKYMFDESGAAVMTQDEAGRRACDDLIEMGYIEDQPAIKTLRDWHARYRARECLPPLPVGRKPKG